MAKKPANLRTCASCEWIFRLNENNDSVECPKCQFGSYGAFYAYGNACYRLAATQKPWYDKKIANYSHTLRATIRTNLAEVYAQPRIFKCQ